MFSWIRFLERHRIPYRTPDRANVAVHCPFCGSEDQGEHMAISLDGHGWKCWRQSSHRGVKNARLIAALIGCSLSEAYSIANERGPVSDPDNFRRKAERALGRDAKADEAKRELRLPSELRPLRSRSLTNALYWNYLTASFDRDGRGYNQEQAEWIAEKYNLHYALSGPYQRRVVFPVYDMRGQLVSWTGRALSDSEPMRYRSPPVAETGHHIRDHLLALPLLTHCPKPRTLVVAEGPFDATRISVFGHKRGVWGTAMFGVAPTDAQLILLRQLRERFDNVVLVQDAGMGLQDKRTLLRAGGLLALVKLPTGVKDPGRLSPSQAMALASELAYG